MILFVQANQLNQLGYDIIIMGHKVNQVYDSFPVMSTAGTAQDFLQKYPVVVKLWRKYFTESTACSNFVL